MQMQARELLIQPVTTLLGVTAAAADALKTIGVEKVFDLGASAVFAQARAAARAADPESAAARFGDVPGDWLAPDMAIESLEEVARLDVAALRALTAAQAQALKTALDVATIGELAAWPPYVTAASLISVDAGGVVDPEDQEAESLRPRFGEFPTERMYYSTLVLLHANQDAAQLVELAGPVSIAGAMRPPAAATRPAVGAIVRFSQSWYAQGVTLGQMLHSLALAPGEATRIAMIDWSRVTSARATETIGESEGLSSSQSHSRAISEVQNAVANEMQEGGSTATSTSSTWSLSASLGIAGAIGSAVGALGASGGYAKSTTSAASSSWSMGSKSVTAEMAQKVADRTEQHSTLVRNRRATAVREVSQSEHEQISTRIVANYNHMHALTLQYYEVVQIYRVVTEVRGADRVLLIPMQLIDFNDANIVNAYRGALLVGALTRRAANLLAEPTGSVELRPASALAPSPISPVLRTGFASAVNVAIDPAASAAPSAPPSPPPPQTTGIIVGTVAMPVGLIVERETSLATAAAITGSFVTRPGSSSFFYPSEVDIVGVRIDGLLLNSVVLVAQAGSRANVQLAAGSGVVLAELDGARPLVDFKEITVIKGDALAQSGVIRLVLSFRGRRFDSPPLRVTMPQSRANTSFTVATLRGDAGDRMEELKAHLVANQGHYSAVVFSSLDTTQVAALLSGYRWNGKPLTAQIEPRILSLAGNYLVVRAPVEGSDPAGFPNGNGQAQTWDGALKALDLTPGGQQDARLIPIPTTGVFAEAVLGRSNSAEKIDLTRFWNWQDSPPTFAPPEIAPVAAGSRAQAEALMPGQLRPANLGIQAPTALPDPAGLGAVLTALARGDTFRDMSGLAGTQTLAKANLEASGAALRASISASTEAMKVAADLFKAGKPDEAQAVQEQANKQVEAAQKAHDADKAKVDQAQRQIEQQLGKAVTGAQGVSDTLARAVAKGEPVPGEPPPSDTVRGGHMRRADEKQAEAAKRGLTMAKKVANFAASSGMLGLGPRYPIPGQWNVSFGVNGQDWIANNPLETPDRFYSSLQITDLPKNARSGDEIHIFVFGRSAVDESPADFMARLTAAATSSDLDAVTNILQQGPTKVLGPKMYKGVAIVPYDEFAKAQTIEVWLSAARKIEPQTFRKPSGSAPPTLTPVPGGTIVETASAALETIARLTTSVIIAATPDPEVKQVTTDVLELKDNPPMILLW